LTARLAGWRLYWRARKWAARLLFRSRRFRFRLLQRGAAISEGASARRALLRGALGLASTAILVVLGLWALQTWRFQILDFLHLNDGWLHAQASRKMNPSSYDLMLQTLAAASGVLLALYLTIVTTVAATVYAAVPHDVRNLMLQDKIGNAYVKGVALLTAVSALLLIGRGAGASAWVVAAPVLAALALFAIYAFVRLGLRTFYFFDPTVLSGSVRFEFRRWVGRARGKRAAGRDASFQDFFRRRARTSVGAYATLVRVTSTQKDFNVEPLERLSDSIIRTLRYYASVKHQIPTSSRWFGQTLQHTPWVLADATELMVAAPTATLLMPKPVPDRNWVEEALFDALLEILKTDLDARRYPEAGQLLARIADEIEEIAASADAALAMRLTSRVAHQSVEVILKTPTVDAAEERGAMGVLDCVMVVLIGVEVGMLRAIRDAAVAPLRGDLSTPGNLRDVARRYRLPTRVAESLESMAEQLAFERQSDAPVRTPSWFVTEISLNDHAHSLEDQLREFARWVVPLTNGLVDQALAEERWVEAAALASRGVELARRLFVLYGEGEDLAATLAEGAKLGDDIIRPQWNWDAYRNQLDAFEDEIGERLVKTIGPLAILEPREDIPDYLGQAVHQAGEACFDALVSGDAVRFNVLYKHYFQGALAVYLRLAEHLRNRQPLAAFPWLVQPLIELLTLSGYALVFAELHDEPELWRTAKATWDDYLAAPEGAARMQLVCSVILAKEGVLGMAARDLSRTWDTQLNAELSKLPRARPAHGFGMGTVQHASPLIVELGRGAYGYGRTAGLDVFVARYLLAHALAPGQGFDRVARRSDRIRQLPQLGAER